MPFDIAKLLRFETQLNGQVRETQLKRTRYWLIIYLFIYLVLKMQV